MRRITGLHGLIVALVVCLLLAGCVRGQELTTEYQVFLPAVAYDCS